MLILLIVAAVLAILSFMATLNGSDAGPPLVVVFGVLALISLLGSVNWRFGSQQLTGYIYSYSNRAGYTTAHIRFSQNAGTDSQPEFCVAANSDAGRAIQKYTGSNTKVDVNIPSYFYLANNPFACGTTNTTITEAK